MEKRLTKKDYFEMIKGVCADRADIVDFCNHEIELLSRKNSKSGATKIQKENEIVANMLVEELAKIGKPITITDLMNTSEIVKNYTLENGNNLTNQKIKNSMNHWRKLHFVIYGKRQLKMLCIMIDT